MNVVVIGGTGLIGSKIVQKLNADGHRATPASLETGLNTITNEGVAEAVSGAEVLVDVSNSPSMADKDAMDFFTTSTKNLIHAARAAGVEHYVVLSVVGAEKLPDSGYLRAKTAQEELIATSGIDFTVVRATQFYEFLAGIGEASVLDGKLHLPPVMFQPMAADDVAAAVASAAVDVPEQGVREVGGPEPVPMDEMVLAALRAKGDEREVVVDPHATYFGARLDEDSLVPGPEARLSSVTYAEWAATSH